MLLVVSLKVSIIDVKRTDMKRSNNADNYREHKTTNDLFIMTLMFILIQKVIKLWENLMI